MLSKEDMIDEIIRSNLESLDYKDLIRFYSDAQYHEMFHFWSDEEIKEAYTEQIGDLNE